MFQDDVSWSYQRAAVKLMESSACDRDNYGHASAALRGRAFALLLSFLLRLIRSCPCTFARLYICTCYTRTRTRTRTHTHTQTRTHWAALHFHPLPFSSRDTCPSRRWHTCQTQLSPPRLPQRFPSPPISPPRQTHKADKVHHVVEEEDAAAQADGDGVGHLPPRLGTAEAAAHLVHLRLHLRAGDSGSAQGERLGAWQEMTTALHRERERERQSAGDERTAGGPARLPHSTRLTSGPRAADSSAVSGPSASAISDCTSVSPVWTSSSI